MSDSATVNQIEKQQFIEKLLEIIGLRLKRILPQAEALILIGSFGREEGCVKRIGGKVKILNDLDFVLVSEPLSLFQRLALKRLNKELCAELGLWHLDIIQLTKSQLSSSNIKMMYYDLKMASKVIWGDKLIAEIIPYNEETKIPLIELQNLVINRLVTLLEGHPCLYLLDSHAHEARQIAKCYFAVIDALLVQANLYKSRYKEKLAALEAIATNDSTVAKELVDRSDWIWRAFNFELNPEQLEINQLHPIWLHARKLLIEQIITLSSKIDQTLYRKIEELLPRWRENFKRSQWQNLIGKILGMMQARPIKHQVEIRLALMLESYPESKKFNIANYTFNVPADINSKQTVIKRADHEWSQFAATLISDWYKA